MTTTLIKSAEVKRTWYEFDASQFPLGRLCTRIAKILMGKHHVSYTPNVDGGDFVVVKNASNVWVSGRKEEQKEYTRFSGYPGGITRTSFKKLKQESPEFIITHAVNLMLPKNKLRKLMIRRLRVVRDDKHAFPVEHKVTS